MKKSLLFSLDYFLRHEIRNLKLEGTCALITGGLALLLTLMIPTTYRATAHIVVGLGRTETSVIKDYATLEQYIWRQHKVLKSHVILNAVVKKLHLRLSKTFVGQDPLKLLNDMIKLTHEKNTKLIGIEVYDTNPILAARIAGSLAEEYLAYMKTKRIQLAQEALDWVSETQRLSEKIKEIDKALNEMQRNQSQDIFYSNITHAEQKHERAVKMREQNAFRLHTRKNEIEYVKELIKKKRVSELIAVFKYDSAMQDIKRERNEIKIALLEASRVSNNSKRITTLEKALGDVENTIIRYAGEQLSVKEKETDTLAERMKRFDETIAESADKVAEFKTKRTQREKLARDKEICTALYKKELGKIKDEQFAVLEVTGIHVPSLEGIVEVAGPNMTLNILFGALGGFILGSIIALFNVEPTVEEEEKRKFK